MTTIPPPSTPEPESDARVRRMETLISLVLRVGVTLSLFFVVTGTVISFFHHPEYTSSPEELHHLTEPGQAFPRTPGEILNGVRDLHGQAVVTLGLVLLIITPVLRVAVSIPAFILQGDRVFTFITILVLIFLLLSFALGGAE
jgi:uncharacterized membrane protein